MTDNDILAWLNDNDYKVYPLVHSEERKFGSEVKHVALYTEIIVEDLRLKKQGKKYDFTWKERDYSKAKDRGVRVQKLLKNVMKTVYEKNRDTRSIT